LEHLSIFGVYVNDMSKFAALIVISSFLVLADCSSTTPPANEKDSSSSPNQADSNAEEKYGLPEAMREQICKELEQLWLQALGEASKKYPYNLIAKLLGNEKTRQRMAEQSSKQAKLYRSLMDRYISEVAKKYNLSPEQLADINEEGIEKGWRRNPPPRTPIGK
jgi:hypothetical protein